MHHQTEDRGSVGFRRTEMLRIYKEAAGMRSVNPSAALDLAKKSRDLAIELGDKDYSSRSEQIMAICFNLLGETQKALRLFSNVLSIRRKYFPDDHIRLCQNTHALGIVQDQMGNREQALDYFLKALQFDFRQEHPVIYCSIGVLQGQIEQYDKAIMSFDEGIKVAYEIHNKYYQALLNFNKSFAFLKLEKIQEAKSSLHQVLTVIKNSIEEDRRYTKIHIHTLAALGQIYLQENELEQALTMSTNALEIANKQSFHLSQCNVMALQAKIYLKKNEESKAISYFERTLHYSEQYEVAYCKKDLLEYFIDFYENNGELNKAYPFIKQLKGAMEKELIDSRGKNINQIIEEREKEIKLLEQKNQEIKRHNVKLEQFTHIISHDMREPVRGIVSFATLIRNKYGDVLGDEFREYLQFMVDDAQALNLKWNRLLSYNAIQKQAIQKVKLAEIIDCVDKMYKTKLAPNQLNITYSVGNIQMAYAHAFTLINELTDNAVKFKKKDEPCVIKIEHQANGDTHQLLVTDYGIGIDEEYHEKVFKMFQRLHKTYEGVGAGLAVCERIVQLYDGEIRIESLPGVFTTVHVTIPNVVINN